MSVKQPYATDDLTLVCTLDCLGYNVTDIHYPVPFKAVFTFENSFNLQSTIQEYWQDKLLVSPSKFVNSQRNIRSRMKLAEKQVN